jgi:hypothetical protein
MFKAVLERSLVAGAKAAAEVARRAQKTAENFMVVERTLVLLTESEIIQFQSEANKRFAVVETC